MVTVEPKLATVEGKDIKLQYIRCDDWLIIAADPDGKLYCVMTELWPEWLDMPARADSQAGAVERWMLPIAFIRWANLNWRPVN